MWQTLENFIAKECNIKGFAISSVSISNFFLSKEDVDVFLVFDKYFKYAIKNGTRGQRTGNLANNHFLSLDAPPPSREIVMTSSQNKTQAIDIISKYIIDILAVNHCRNRLVVTCSEATPLQVQERMVN